MGWSKRWLLALWLGASGIMLTDARGQDRAPAVRLGAPITQAPVIVPAGASTVQRVQFQQAQPPTHIVLVQGRPLFLLHPCFLLGLRLRLLRQRSQVYPDLPLPLASILTSNWVIRAPHSSSAKPATTWASQGAHLGGAGSRAITASTR